MTGPIGSPRNSVASPKLPEPEVERKNSNTSQPSTPASITESPYGFPSVDSDDQSAPASSKQTPVNGNAPRVQTQLENIVKNSAIVEPSKLSEVSKSHDSQKNQNKLQENSNDFQKYFKPIKTVSVVALMALAVTTAVCAQLGVLFVAAPYLLAAALIVGFVFGTAMALSSTNGVEKTSPSVNTAVFLEHPAIIELFKNSTLTMKEVGEGESTQRNVKDELGKIIRNSFFVLDTNYNKLEGIHDKHLYDTERYLVDKMSDGGKTNLTKAQKQILKDVSKQIIDCLKKTNDGTSYDMEKMGEIVSQLDGKGFTFIEDEDNKLGFNLGLQSRNFGILLPIRAEAAADFNKVLDEFYVKINLEKIPKNFVMNPDGSLNENVAKRLKEIIDDSQQ